MRDQMDAAFIFHTQCRHKKPTLYYWIDIVVCFWISHWYYSDVSQFLIWIFYFPALYIRSERSGHCVEKRWSTFPEAGCVDGSRTAGQCHGRYSSRAGRVTGPAVQNVLSEHWALLKPTALNRNPSLHSTAPDRSFLTERNNVNVPSGNDLMYVQDSGRNAKPRFFSLKGAAPHSFGGHPSPSIALRGCIWRRF